MYALAVTTTDRYGNRAYVWLDGVSIAHDGYGRMAWTLYRTPDCTDTYFTTTLGDAVANI